MRTRCQTQLTTRGLLAQEMTGANRWITGSTFLLDEIRWPERLKMTVELLNDPEILPYSTLSNTSLTRDAYENEYLTKFWTYYCSWHRLQEGVTWILRFQDWFKNIRQPQRTSSRLELIELRRAKYLTTSAAGTVT